MTSMSYLYTVKHDGCLPVEVHQNNGVYFGVCGPYKFVGTEAEINEWAKTLRLEVKE